MLNPRWAKVWRDLSISRYRMAVAGFAIAISLTGVFTVLGAYAILTREMARNYAMSAPPEAILQVHGGASEALEAARQYDEVSKVQPRMTLSGRIKSQGQWSLLRLFVVEDFENMSVGLISRESGAWPPPTGTLLVERSSLPVLGAKEGAEVTLSLSMGLYHNASVSGIVHDRALAPGTMESTVYAYATAATLRAMGYEGGLDELWVRMKGTQVQTKGMDAAVMGLADALRAKGVEVGQVMVPPTGRHPHQSQMQSILMMLAIFAVLALALSMLLVGNIINSLMARQVREIGVMKVLGAAQGQLMSMYSAMALALGLSALPFAGVVGALGARAFAAKVAGMLNFTIFDPGFPWWVYLVLVAAGAIVPLLSALLPVMGAVRVPPVKALNDYGVSAASAKVEAGGLAMAVSTGSRITSLSLRNMFRRRARLVMVLALLSSAGALFISGLSVSKAWDRAYQRIYVEKRHDLELRLTGSVRQEAIERALHGQGDGLVDAMEVWLSDTVTLGKSGISRQYPDGGHGSMHLYGIPADTKMLRLPLLSGRWLRHQDTDAVVINHTVLGQAPDIKVGDTVELAVEGREYRLHVVGIAEEALTPASFYVNRGFLEEQGGGDSLVRLSLHNKNDATAAQKIESALFMAGIKVAAVTSITQVRNAVAEHINILIACLVLLSAMMAAVGLLGLSAVMNINVAERTREIGVMKALGADYRTVMRIVMAEAVFMGLVGLALGLMAAVPLSMAIGWVLGMIAFRLPLGLAVSAGAAGLWAMLCLGLSAMAGAQPAHKAAMLSVREATGYAG